ncbi:MAG: hypothetical protein KZQ83_01125 [gamma proteobacterium symbiont of Taylorina sp.]|nr:hypothetical protein [gamma proteobacterium symbiont of Taylorina sp.]
MVFVTEPTGYEKTALSDLQGSWGNLRDAVVENFGFPNSDKLMFHISEAMSWESVRNLKQMKGTLLIIQNIAVQAKAPEEVTELIEDVRQDLEIVFDEIAEGNID